MMAEMCVLRRYIERIANVVKLFRFIKPPEISPEGIGKLIAIIILSNIVVEAPEVVSKSIDKFADISSLVTFTPPSVVSVGFPGLRCLCKLGVNILISIAIAKVVKTVAPRVIDIRRCSGDWRDG